MAQRKGPVSVPGGDPPRSSSRHETKAWKVGSVIAGKYLLQEHLARGGFTDVYRGEHAFTGQRLAVKILKADLVGVKGLAERMHNEAMVSGRVQHPNHVMIFDAGVIDGRVYIVMELLEGHDGRELLAIEGPLGIERARYIISEVADGLIAAHKIGITHRDLKPENVFVTSGNLVKLLDFGNAKFVDTGPRFTEDGRVHGTLPYMSPEQLAGSDVDARTDVFAAGVIFYELLLGRHPFATGPYEWPPERELRELMNRWKLEPLPKLRTEVPHGLWKVIEKATQKDPALRYQSVEAFKSDIDQQGRFGGAFRVIGPDPSDETSGESSAALGVTESDSEASTSGVTDRTQSMSEDLASEPAPAPVRQPRPTRPARRHAPAPRRRNTGLMLGGAIGLGAVVGVTSVLWFGRGPTRAPEPATARAQEAPATREAPATTTPVEKPSAAAPPAPIASAPVVALASASSVPAARPRAPAHAAPMKVPDALMVPDFIKESEISRSKPAAASAPGRR